MTSDSCLYLKRVPGMTTDNPKHLGYSSEIPLQITAPITKIKLLSCRDDRVTERYGQAGWVG